jgi:acylphosphatase
MSAAVRHIVIRGRVQGVGYRAWVATEAQRYALEGWVRNRRDGSVEAVFAGSTDVLARMIADCRRGPALARVEAIEEQPVADDALLKLRPQGARFAVLATV